MYVLRIRLFWGLGLHLQKYYYVFTFVIQTGKQRMIPDHKNQQQNPVD